MVFGSSLVRVLLLVGAVTGENLDEFLDNIEFQPIVYEIAKVRAKRDSEHSNSHAQPNVSIVAFTAFKHNFTLELHQADLQDVFTDDFQMTDGSGKVVARGNHFESNLVEGEDKNAPGSKVQGIISNGLFIGSIRENNSEFFVDSSDIIGNASLGREAHSVIYKKKNGKLTSARSFCGVTHSDLEAEPQPQSMKMKRSYERLLAQSHLRSPNSSTCGIRVVVDGHLSKHLSRTDRSARDLVGLLVKQVSEMYEWTVFATDRNFKDYKDLSFAGLLISVQHLMIFTEQESQQACRKNLKSYHCENLDSHSTLDNFKREVFNLFPVCLNYLFTYREFEKHTLGMAFFQGLCQSSNQGFVSFSTNGVATSMQTNVITFAHEIGHNFGAQHDEEEYCPASTFHYTKEGGNFVMYATNSGGGYPNNRNFSTCSKHHIATMINEILSHGTFCLAPRKTSYCGNQILEENEECDCGTNAQCKKNGEKCCNIYHDNKEKHDKNCKLLTSTLDKKVLCSHQQACCTADCAFALSGKPCRNETDCAMPAFCNGISANCPPSQPKTNYIPCGRTQQQLSNRKPYVRTCYNGECSASLCRVSEHADECQLEIPQSQLRNVLDPQQYCYLSCKHLGQKHGECVSSYWWQVATQAKDEAKLHQLRTKYPWMEDILHNYSYNGSGIALPGGSLCNNNKGYCDYNQRCRAANKRGSLQRLLTLFFSSESLIAVARMALRYWWATLLVSIGSVAAMCVLIRTLEYKTPSSLAVWNTHAKYDAVRTEFLLWVAKGKSKVTVKSKGIGKNCKKRPRLAISHSEVQEALKKLKKLKQPNRSK